MPLALKVEVDERSLDDAGNHIASAFDSIGGSGTGQPTGIITSLVGSAGTVPLITPGTPETLVCG